MSIIVQRDANIYSFVIFLQTALDVSDDTLIHHQEHTQTVITTSGTGRTVVLPSADVEESVRPVPDVVITVLSVLLMTDEGFIRNIWSCLQKYNKTVYTM